MISLFFPGIHERRTDLLAVLELIVEPIQGLLAFDVAFTRDSSSFE